MSDWESHSVLSFGRDRQWRRNWGFRRFNEPGPRAPGAPSSGPQKNLDKILRKVIIKIVATR